MVGRYQCPDAYVDHASDTGQLSTGMVGRYPCPDAYVVHASDTGQLE